MKLKTVVLTSTNDGLSNEKGHLVIELRETRALQKSYETKCNELMVELAQTTSEYQETKRQMVGHNEMSREREGRIDKLREDLAGLKDSFD